MFVHPQCTCSRASLTELGRLMATVGDRVSPVVVLVQPHDTEPSSQSDELRHIAAGMPGVAIVDDEDAAETHRFGAATSGACLLYDAHGTLAYAGGITSSRGHEGENLGEERIVRLLTGAVADRRDGPIFGCALEQRGSPVKEVQQ